MDFKNKTHEKFYKNVQDWLFEIAPQGLRRLDDGAFVFRYGSTNIAVSISTLEINDKVELMTFVSALVVNEPAFTPELLEFLLRKNMEEAFGGFGIRNNQILIMYSFLGDHLSKTLLLETV